MHELFIHVAREVDDGESFLVRSQVQHHQFANHIAMPAHENRVTLGQRVLAPWRESVFVLFHELLGLPEIPFPEFGEPESEPETGSDVTPDVVRTLRKRMKLTQIQFGEIFGISSKKVSAWEHDKAAPSEEQKQKIQSLLKENNG